jgi:hypothetical protein
MHWPLFKRISHEVTVMNPYFIWKPDALSVMGFHPFHKCVVTMKMLDRGSIVDDMDDEYAMGESTILDCVKEFTSTIVDQMLQRCNTLLLRMKLRNFQGC